MLIIIDIQEYYLDEFRKQQNKFNKMIAGLRKRIQQARRIDELVVNLTCFDDGVTIPEILKLIADYPNKVFLGKGNYDGSTSLKGLFEIKGIRPKSIELCGVFKDVCVLETWKGLKKLGYNVSSINANLTLATSSNWRKIEKYPEGYI